MTQHKTILERLDDSVRWTGIPALAQGHPRRRPLRWPSTIALLLAVTGFAIDFGRPGAWLGYAVLMLGFGLANFMPIWGPLKPWGGTERVDEFDRALRARAYLFTFTLLSAIAVFGLWTIVAVSGIDRWDINTMRDTLTKLAFLLAAIYTAGPTCYASWRASPSAEDEA